ncbi:MAG: hypothetical protein GX092_00505 [Clostridia bacterium]|nr:hypothetical protein [Clostridia bacterium]
MLKQMYNAELNKLQKKIEDEIMETFYCWELLDEHGALVKKEDIYKLAIMEDRMRYYEEKGILVYDENVPILERITDDSRLGNDLPEAPLRISYMRHPEFPRYNVTPEDWREFRLSFDKESFLFRMTLPLRNAALKEKIEKETALMEKLFLEGDRSNTDKCMDEYMLTKSMEILAPLIKEREELYEIIRREMGFDYHDLMRLRELEKMRDKLLELESNKERLEFLERYEQYRPEIFKEFEESRKEIDYMLSRLEQCNDNNKNKNNDKVFDIQHFLENVKNNTIFKDDRDKKEKVPVERPKIPASPWGRF